MSLKAIAELPLEVAKGAAPGANLPAAVTAGVKTAGISAAGQAREWAVANPAAAVGAALVVGGAATMVAPSAVAVPVLNSAGFGAGVAKASAAATVQSDIGNVVGGSVFATLQSAGAGGYGVAAVNGAVQAGGACVAAVGGSMVARAKMKANV